MGIGSTRDRLDALHKQQGSRGCSSCVSGVWASTAADRKHLGMAVAVTEAELSAVPNDAITEAADCGHACPFLTKTVPAHDGSVGQD